jgi:hypothetical protein
MQLVLTEKGEDGFFLPKGDGATVSCSNPVGDNGPSHFEPQWLFRDTFSDHAQLTSTAAFIIVSTKLLPKGSASLPFPHEIGSVNDTVRGKYGWDNRGTLRVTTRPA